MLTVKGCSLISFVALESRIQQHIKMMKTKHTIWS